MRSSFSATRRARHRLPERKVGLYRVPLELWMNETPRWTPPRFAPRGPNKSARGNAREPRNPHEQALKGRHRRRLRPSLFRPVRAALGVVVATVPGRSTYSIYVVSPCLSGEYPSMVPTDISTTTVLMTSGRLSYGPQARISYSKNLYDTDGISWLPRAGMFDPFGATTRFGQPRSWWYWARSLE